MVDPVTAMGKTSMRILKTLGDYRKVAMLLFGQESGATKFLNDRIVAQGEDEEVLADESQMIYLLVQMDKETRSYNAG